MKSIDERVLCVEPGRRIRLDDFDPAATPGFAGKAAGEKKLAADVEKFSELQEIFAANPKHGLLVILQGSDAAGKDGIVKHVASGIDAFGVTVTDFKEPSEEERAHDFLWRCSKALPARGHIAIFNRSYYEEVGVVRVHPEFLTGEGLRKNRKRLWNERFEDIVAFERYLTRNGIVVVKFFLNLSKEEQRKRLLARAGDPKKQWKIDSADLRERASWSAYQHAYSEMLTYTNTEWAPWYVIPADHKWFARIAVADVLVKRMRALHLAYPAISDERKAFLKGAQETLSAG